MTNLKIAVAMSGGVDSGVAAALLVKKGYKCTGFHLKLWQESQNSNGKPQTFENKCCTSESLEAARRTCQKLGIPFYTLDFQEIFKKKVVDYFLEEYGRGLTPNPCVMCNKYIKFGRLLEYVRGLGFDYLATGHYARVSAQCQMANVKTQNYNLKLKTYHLLQAKDKSKDQSYFLYNLTQEQLAHILFPVGEYTKKEVREIAKKWKLPVAERPESQEICFLPENDYRLFLKRHIPEKLIPGEVVDNRGKVIGWHFGLPLYTIGQRHGFEISSKFKVQNSGFISPYYVVDKDRKKNRLIVGTAKEAERKTFEVIQVNLVNPQLKIESWKKLEIFVKIRSQGELLKGKIEKLKAKKQLRGRERMRVILNKSQRGIASGQAAVFYQKFKLKDLKSKEDGYEVVGGGIIV